MQTIDAATPEEDKEAGEVARWVGEIKLYDKQAQAWHEKARKILRRFKDERTPREGNVARFNVLWSNTQTLLPALYSKPPKPDIERRFKDGDDLGRITSQVLERAVSYSVTESTFNEVMRQCVTDRLLPGRGTMWVRYVPHFRDMEIAGNNEVQSEGVQATDDQYAEEETPKEVYYEEVCPDYVHWQDFGHTIARTWEEVRAVWRIVYLDKDELEERFGEELAKEIPLDYSPKGLNDEKIQEGMKKASIYEIWDKPSKKAIWLHKDYPKRLDVRNDPLRLPDFFPCPRPLYTNLANDSLIPVPDYVQYQDQAKEIDDLTSRIASITKAIKVAGVYDSTAQGVERLLAEGVENMLVPVESWAVHADKGGLKGVMELMPMQEIANTLLVLYQTRDAIKKDLYEITGMSDILRGDTDANETAAAQHIKSQFAMMRLRDMQSDVQRFARDAVRIMAVIIADHFGLDTIRKISGLDLFTAQDKQRTEMGLQQQQALAQQQGQQTPPPDDHLQEKLKNPTWEEVEALLRDDAARCFRIGIETDSTIRADEEAEKKSRVEFLNAAGGFLQQAMQVQNPALIPLLSQMLMFGVRGFSVGKELEGAFEVAIGKLEREAANPQPKPDPEMAKIQGQMQIEQAKAQNQAQLEQVKAQTSVEIERGKQQAQLQQAQHLNEIEAQRDALKAQYEKDLEMFRAQKEFEAEQMRQASESDLKWKIAQLESETKIVVAEIQARSAVTQSDAAGT